MTLPHALLDDPNRLLRPSQVAGIFNVDPKTVTRWAIQGDLVSVRTPRGHRRYRVADVQAAYEKWQARYATDPDLVVATVDGPS